MPKRKTPVQQTQSKAQEVTAPKKVRNYRALAFQTYLIVAIVTFTVLAFLANLFPYFKIDLFISQSFQNFNPPLFLEFMVFISYWGFYPQMPIIIIAILVFIFVSGLRWESIVGGINILGAGLIAGILKTLIGRDRPAEDLINVVANLHDKSFPSGHVLTYTAFFGYLWFLSFTLLKPSILRNLLLIIFGGFVILVGPSRVYMGQHWPSDVFGAYLMGSLWLLFTIFLYRLGKKRFFISQPTASERQS